MRVLAVIVMVLGLMLMSAPLVLPRLGVTFAVSASPSVPPSTPDRPAEGAGALAGMGNLLAKGVGSAAAYLGVAPKEGTPAPADVAANLAAACEALPSAAGCGPVSGADFAATSSEAAGILASGEVPPEAVAAVPVTGAAPEGRASGVSIIETSKRPSQGGAKFVKARGNAPEAASP